MQHTAIIEKLGGIRKLARKLNHEHHTRVQGWNERNSIPLEHWSAILDVAKDDNEPLTITDLMPSDLREASEQAAAA